MTQPADHGKLTGFGTMTPVRLLIAPGYRRTFLPGWGDVIVLSAAPDDRQVCRHE
jgi:hypothetical protein